MRKLHFFIALFISLVSVYAQSSIEYIDYTDNLISVPINNGQVIIHQTGIKQILNNNLELITCLKLSYVNLDDFSIFEHAISIKRLELWHTIIKDYSFLRNLKKLETLWIEGEDLSSKIIDLQENRQLIELVITNCKLKDLSRVKGVPESIELIFLWYNEIINTPLYLLDRYKSLILVFIEKKIAGIIESDRLVYKNSQIPEIYRQFLP